MESENKTIIDNPGESGNESVYKSWHDNLFDYFKFKGLNDEEYVVKRYYGGLDINYSKYNTYQLFKIDKENKNEEQQKMENITFSKENLDINCVSYILKNFEDNLYLIYYFLDQRLNNSKHETENKDIFIVDAFCGKSEFLTKLKYLGFVDCDKKYFCITKEYFNKSKIEILERINKLYNSEITEDEINQKIQNESNEYENRKMFFKDLFESDKNEKINASKKLINDQINASKKLKFQLNIFQKIIGLVVEFILTILHIRKTNFQQLRESGASNIENISEQDAYEELHGTNNFYFLRIAKTNSKTIADKIKFNKAVDHFIEKKNQEIQKLN
jgi:hypothetical protein